VALGERNGRPFRDGPLSLLAGPERIESGWWEDRSVQRDYFVAEDSLHRLLWIYRERLRDDAAGGWFLHGRFG
jgi:protein ImuB